MYMFCFIQNKPYFTSYPYFVNYREQNLSSDIDLKRSNEQKTDVNRGSVIVMELVINLKITFIAYKSIIMKKYFIETKPIKWLIYVEF